MSSPKVIIIGAAISGLAFASALRARGIPFEIYERDAHVDARQQGYAISIRWFIDVLKRNAPPSAPDFDSVNVLYNTGLEPTLNLYEKGYGAPVLSMKGAEETGVRANRGRLRKWLMTEINVKWGFKFESYEVLEDGKVKVNFDGGRSTVGDVLVGADGVQSHVRQLLYNQNPQHIAPHLSAIKVAVVGGQVEVNKSQLEDFFKFASAIGISSAEKVKMLTGLTDCAPDLSRATVYWLVVWYDEHMDDRTHWIYTADSATLLEEARTRTLGAINPDFTKPLYYTKPEEVFVPGIVFRNMLPQLSPPGPVTLIGDAAHAMGPFRGEGGNHAVEDALSLAESLSSSPNNIDAALRAYEKAMVPRAELSVRTAHRAAHQWGKDFAPSSAEHEFSVKDSTTHSLTT